MSDHTSCPFEDLPLAARRVRLHDDAGRRHARGCETCTAFLAVDTALLDLAAALPPVPTRARWAGFQLEWRRRDAAGESTSYYGDLIARALGLLGIVLALAVLTRSLAGTGSLWAMPGSSPTLWLVVIGAVIAGGLILRAAYRAASESDFDS